MVEVRMPRFGEPNVPPPPPAVDRVAAEREAVARERALARDKSLAGLRRAADLVIVLGWLIGLGGMIFGFVIAISGGDNEDYPYVGLGVAVGGGAVVVAAFMTLFAYWALAWIDSQS